MSTALNTINQGDIYQFGEYGPAYEILEPVDAQNPKYMIKILILETGTVDATTVEEIKQSIRLV